MTRCPRSAVDAVDSVPAPDAGVGLIGSVAALLAAILFLAFSAQVLLSLYATTTVRATLHDAASRAANQGTTVSQQALDEIATRSMTSLGQMGDRTSIVLEAVDTDGNGEADVVVGEAVSVPPRLVPASVTGVAGFDEVRVGVRVRIERPR